MVCRNGEDSPTDPNEIEMISNMLQLTAGEGRGP